MKIGHVLITYFCVRIDAYWKQFDRDNSHRSGDPLDPDSLSDRIALFETICLPSMVNQSTQNFAWVILTDRDLPASFAGRLENMVAGHANIHLHTFRETDQIENCDWLLPYLAEDNYTHLLTSLLDDDDALPRHYVEKLQAYLLTSMKTASLPFCILGCGKVMQWDLIRTPEAPRGYTSSIWHRRTGAFLLSPGFSLLSQYPEINMSNLILRHRLSKSYLDWDKEPVEENVRIVRNELLRRGKEAGMDVQALVGTSDYRDVGSRTGIPLLVNHAGNVQETRMTEHKIRRKVTDVNNLSEYAINWDAYQKHAAQIIVDLPALPEKKRPITLKRLFTKACHLFSSVWARA